MQGSILSAFFNGYILSQVVGGWLACQYGGVRLLGVSVMLTAALTLLTPLAARTSVYLLMATRVLEGVLQVMCVSVNFTEYCIDFSGEISLK